MNLKYIITLEILSRTIKNIIVHNIWDYKKIHSSWIS